MAGVGVGAGGHPAIQACKDAQRGTVNISVHMRPLLCVLRIGLSALYLGPTMATTDDVIHFLAESAPQATNRLIEAGLAA
ncbi:unnamed protein product, partial [Closterium sp. Naga37s-1]